jgi:hypothetical protein
MAEGENVTDAQLAHPHEVGSWHPDCPACPGEPGPWDIERPAGQLAEPEDEEAEAVP